MDNYLLTALFLGALATILPRLGGVWLSKSLFFTKLNEETLSRLFPLLILFVLLFKESATALSSDGKKGLITITGLFLVAVLHLWKRSMFLSVIGGTVGYIILLKIL